MSRDAEHQGDESAERRGLPEIVELLCSANGLTRRCESKQCAEPLPSRNEVLRITDLLLQALYPGYFGTSEVSTESLRYHVGHNLDDVQRSLQVQVTRGLAFARPEQERSERRVEARQVTGAFLARLPAVRRMLTGDVRAAYEGDPSATSPDETVFCYPGVRAITKHRLAHELYRLGVPLLPRMISEQAHSLTGIDIHPGATVGHGFFIDHGTGVVIGETCVIGDRVRVYQGVTLGAKSFPLDENGNPVKGIARHPIIEDDVVIYSGATILGRVTIGKGSEIGGNVWLTRSVAPASRITVHPPRRELFEHGSGI